MEEKKLFLLDAYALIYRAYYALARSPRFTSQGLNTSAIFGFVNTLQEVLRKEAPAYMAVCFDPKGGHTFRHEMYPEYKAQRDKQPEDITLAIPYIKDIIEAYGIRVIEVERYEADDVIGTLSRLAERAGFTTYMMTPDKDYGQLVTDRVYMYRPSLRGEGFEIRGPQQVCERYGIPSPDRVIDLLALEGDVSDNVPGCPGVGEKTAARLIGEYGSVDDMLAHAAEIKGKLGERIRENAEQIRFSRELVTIKTDVPLPEGVTPDSLLRAEPDFDRLTGIFNQLEFKTLVTRLAQSHPATVAAIAQAAPSLFDNVDESESAPADEKFTFETLDTSEAQAAFLSEAAASSAVGVCVDAAGPDAMSAVLRGVGLSASGRTVYIPLSPFEQEWCDVAALLAPLFGREGLSLISHDVKRDMVLLHRIGVDWTAPWFDTSVAHYLLSPEAPHDLPGVAFAVLHRRTSEYELTATERRKPLAPEASAARAAEHAMITALLRDPLSDSLRRESLWDLYEKIESPLIPVLASMEITGVRVDTAMLSDISRRLTARVADLERQAYEIAGESFNIGSPSQVGQVLFGKLGIDPKAKKTKSGQWSTTEEILEKYAREQPIVRLILEVRGLRKLLATYVDALPGMINPRTGHIHTTFNQIVTATGRISSSNPNLQNIPVRTDDGREIRRAFVADPGCLILSADYSQIELRLMADMSGDEEMLGAFNAGEDIHRATAAKIYHIPLDEVSADLRRNAKTANFGIIYGISAFGLSERLGIPRSEAKELIDGYLTTYPRVAEYMKEAIEGARANGYVSTIHGRKRFLPDINSRNGAIRGYAERNAINAPLQGSAADVIKIAMIAVDREIRTRGLRSRMIMQVHDELIFNVVPDELPVLQPLVTRCMEDAYKGRLRLEVSSGVADNWLEAH